MLVTYREAIFADQGASPDLAPAVAEREGAALTSNSP